MTSADPTPVPPNSPSPAPTHRFKAAILGGQVRAGIRLLARLARVAEQTCQATGISLPQYRLLVSAAHGPQRASELANAVVTIVG